nr:MAG TPA: hypothetical protein [Caudoviricetes sp.]
MCDNENELDVRVTLVDNPGDDKQEPENSTIGSKCEADGDDE